MRNEPLTVLHVEDDWTRPASSHDVCESIALPTTSGWSKTARRCWITRSGDVTIGAQRRTASAMRDFHEESGLFTLADAKMSGRETRQIGKEHPGFRGLPT
jgi:hypothetical protein